jgi:hypothetical protein
VQVWKKALFSLNTPIVHGRLEFPRVTSSGAKQRRKDLSHILEIRNKMKTHHLIIRICTIAASSAIFLTATPASAQLLGTAGNYGALGSSTVTNTGSTIIKGDLGVSPGSAITGFSVIDGGPGQFTGALNIADAASAQARSDLTTAYGTLAALSFNSNLSGQNLGGLTLTPGVYLFNSSAQLTGMLTLNAENNPNAQFVFEIGSTLTTASNSLVNIINISSAKSGPDNGLFWQIGSSATIGTDSMFAGNILALTSITLDTGASIDDGRALALNGAVSLDDNLINASDTSGGFGGGGVTITPVPEASTYGLVGCCVILFVVWHRRQTAGRQNVAPAWPGQSKSSGSLVFEACDQATCRLAHFLFEQGAAPAAPKYIGPSRNRPQPTTSATIF